MFMGGLPSWLDANLQNGYREVWRYGPRGAKAMNCDLSQQQDIGL